VVSYVSTEKCKSHGVTVDEELVEVGSVCEITATTSARVPDEAIFENGKLVEKIWPAVTVKLVEVPIALPVALSRVMLPVHEAAVVLELEARLTTFTWMVSVLPTPTGPIVISLVLVVAVWAKMPGAAAVDATSKVIAILLKNISYLS
jgi:hypothetical protein